MSLTITNTDNAITSDDTQLFDAAISLALKSVSANSARVYSDTFTKWQSFCAVNQTSELDITPSRVYEFLAQYDHSKSTIGRMLSALRSLTRVLAIINPDYQRNLEALKLVNTKQLGTNEKRRTKKALNKRDVARAFDAFLHNTLTDKRDSAVLAVAFYAGLRRSEIVALKWSDIDLENGLITVVGGKGRKENNEAETVAILGDGTAVDILREFKAVSEGREFVFTRILKGEHFGEDKPLTTEVIRRICAKAGDFTPHDARRTLITSMLNNKTPLHIAQRQARHKNGNQTLAYAQVASAEEIKANAKVDY